MKEWWLGRMMTRLRRSSVVQDSSNSFNNLWLQFQVTIEKTLIPMFTLMMMSKIKRRLTAFWKTTKANTQLMKKVMILSISKMWIVEINAIWQKLWIVILQNTSIKLTLVPLQNKIGNNMIDIWEIKSVNYYKN